MNIATSRAVVSKDPYPSPKRPQEATSATASTPEKTPDGFVASETVTDNQLRWQGTAKGALVFGLPAILGTSVHPLLGLGSAAVPIVHASAVTYDQGAAGRGFVGFLGVGLSLLPKPWALAGAGALTILGAVIGRSLAETDIAMRQAENDN